MLYISSSSSDYEEKYLKNPTYGGIAGGSLIGASTYETVNTSQEIAGNYDALNRGQTSGKHFHVCSVN